MATAATSASGTYVVSTGTLTYQDKRWVVIGICLNKVLTPALRRVLSNEMPIWHQTLVKPPQEITKQTLGKYAKNLPPSTIKLNYDSINNNTVHKSPKLYDYAVKDPLSLAKLFMKPFMASFTGFDHTMDTSAVLSVMCEAQPFFTSGAAALAKKVRSDIRNEWAHCDFSHWTEPNFQTAVQDVESLVKKAGLTSVEENLVLHDLNIWKKKALMLFLGTGEDLQLLQMEVEQLKESFQAFNSDVEHKTLVLKKLLAVNLVLQEEVRCLKKRQLNTELKVTELSAAQAGLKSKYISNTMDIKALRDQVNSCDDKNDLNVFHAPDTVACFTGRQRQMKELETVIFTKEKLNGPSARKAAIYGLGGSGKTSLVVEYANRKRNHYEGGVFWFSGEDEKKLKNSVNDLALSIGTFVSNSFDVTLSQTLARISRIQKPWLLIVDDMDELPLSPNIRKLLSGSWQKDCNGTIIVTTRRKPSVLIGDVREFEESSCLELQTFDVDDSKEFLFNRTGISRNEDTETAALNVFEELGGLPLALEQAAAYIKCLGCSFFSYLESYKAKRLVLLNQQRSDPVSEYSSPERLAVQTTWRLNIDYIKQNSEGGNAIRFLNACVFFNPNEIQEELINVGEPPVIDTQFRIFLGTSLGRYQIFKLLTDFSLFKQTSSRCLQVHRIVLDVIKENLSPIEQAESFVDAVRMLQHSFSKGLSPDELLFCVMEKKTDSVDFTNSSLFYLWRTLCLHAGEIQKNMNVFLSLRIGTDTMVFVPETARIVYQYALYLSVFCRHEEAIQTMNFAYKILDWFPEVESELFSAKLNSLFPHALPLPESVRRHIQYCSKAPALSLRNDEECVKKCEKLREEGNRLFRDGCFEEAVKAYSTAIDQVEKPTLLDPRLFSNRASAYLRLNLYVKALEDAKVYISQRPECWKGYARKTLALLGLNDEIGAKLAVYQTHLLFPNVFHEFDPFKKFLHLEKCITFCHSCPDLLRALESGKEVIVLASGTYVISENITFQNCIVLGRVDQCRDMFKMKVNFLNHSGALVRGKCAFANLDFVFQLGNCCSVPYSEVVIQNCSFTSRDEKRPSLDASGVTNVENCEFRNCCSGGLLCVGGSLRVENCTFSGNQKAGLEVRGGGTLLARNINMYNNCQGLTIGPKAKKCIFIDSQVNNSEREGVYCKESDDVSLKNNHIFHNDSFGISIIESKAEISGNSVFENSYWGIWVQSNSCCRISKNKVNRNRVGGVRVGLRSQGSQPSVVDSNTFNDNGGPGFLDSLNDFDVNNFFGRQVYPVPYLLPNETLPLHLQNTLVRAQCKENTSLRNKEKVRHSKSIDATQNGHRFCSYCKKETTLQKCEKCYTAAYCGYPCQRRHWEDFHQQLCPILLERSSIVLTSTKLLPVSLKKDETVPAINIRPHSLKEVASEVGRSPSKDGKRFVVKVQTAYHRSHSNVMLICDRSQEVNKYFQSVRIHSLVRDLGDSCENMYLDKELLMWAAYTKNNLIRLFTNDFPSY